MKDDLFHFLLGLTITATVSMLIMLTVTVSATRRATEAEASERRAWELVQELRSTLAAMGGPEQF